MPKSALIAFMALTAFGYLAAAVLSTETGRLAAAVLTAAIVFAGSIMSPKSQRR
jgi:hypothetical protein